jgi:hypothetical protein
VDAALDAQDILTGGATCVTTPPPPCFPRRRRPALPAIPPVAPPKRSRAENNNNNNNNKSVLLLKRRPLRPDVEYWDAPLKMPKIIVTTELAKKATATSTSTETPRHSAKVVVLGPRQYTINDITQEEESKLVHVDQWVGVAGVDLFEHSRSRVAHVRMPDALSVQCFIFPICHDGFLYGKVMQVQASRRAIAPVLVDKELLDMVRTEGALVRKHAHSPRRKKQQKAKAKDAGDADVLDEEPEQEEDEETQDEDAAWPGLEYLLPVHVLTEATTY